MSKKRYDQLETQAQWIASNPTQSCDVTYLYNDPSDFHKFKIGKSSTLGDNVALTIDCDGVIHGNFAGTINGASSLGGPAGDRGETGATGATGATGPAGDTGETGATGDTGASGVIGATGGGGNTGVTSTSAGDPGISGTGGEAGDGGVGGLVGATGIDGDDGTGGVGGTGGETGVGGDVGESGVFGTTGEAGVTGQGGDGGFVGITGDPGAPGTAGVKGPTGPEGDCGATGCTGATGVSGTTGCTGATGDIGETGLPGLDGDIGGDGDQGTPVGELTAIGTDFLWGFVGAQISGGNPVFSSVQRFCLLLNQIIAVGNACPSGGGCFAAEITMDFSWTDGVVGQTFVVSSDARLKENIIEIENSTKYAHLNLKEYKWSWNQLASALYNLKGEAQGVMAEEVMEVLPGAVIKDKHGYLNVVYDYLDPFFAWPIPDPSVEEPCEKSRRELRENFEDLLHSFNFKV